MGVYKAGNNTRHRTSSHRLDSEAYETVTSIGISDTVARDGFYYRNLIPGTVTKPLASHECSGGKSITQPGLTTDQKVGGSSPSKRTPE